MLILPAEYIKFNHKNIGYESNIFLDSSFSSSSLKITIGPRDHHINKNHETNRVRMIYDRLYILVIRGEFTGKYINI